MKLLFGIAIGVLGYKYWDVIHPWIVSVLESLLNVIK